MFTLIQYLNLTDFDGIPLELVRQQNQYLYSKILYVMAACHLKMGTKFFVTIFLIIFKSTKDTMARWHASVHYRIIKVTSVLLYVF